MPYTENLKIRTSDCDKDLNLTPSSIFDLFQETAARHCIPYRIDSPTLIREKGITWVLTGMALRVDSYPKWPEILKIDTWTKGFQGFKALRDYSASNENGENIIFGTSVWATINLETRRPVKLESLKPGWEIEPDNNIFSDIKPGRPNVLEHNGQNDTEIIVNRNDLDMNNHVGNIQYIVWMYSYLNDDFLNSMELSFINISYKGETHLNDELIFKSTIIENQGYHSFIDKKTDREICSISSKWRKKS